MTDDSAAAERYNARIEAFMSSHELIAALRLRRNNDVVVQVGGTRVQIIGCGYDPNTDQIVLELDPLELQTALACDDD